MFAASELLAYAAALCPDRTAIVKGRTSVSYRELIEWADDLADAIRSRNVEPGSRVAVLASNGPEYVASLFAIWNAGGIAMPLHESSPRAELRELCQMARPELMLVEKVHAKSVDFAPTLKVCASERSGSARRPRRGHRGGSRADAPAVVLFTSGSTGRPKGVVLTHDNIVTCALLATSTMQMVPTDRVFTCVPMTHAYGQNRGLLCPLVARATIVVADEMLTASMSGLIAQIDDAKASVLVATPNLYAMLAAGTSIQLTGVRLGVSAGSVLPPAVKTRFEQRFGVPVLVAYGATETSPGIASGVVGVPHLPGSVGYPFPGVEVELRDPHAHDQPNAEEGLLFVRGHNVMCGYLDDPSSTDRVVRDGWFDTGDIARRNEDGSLSILGRASGMAKRNGFRVFPAEVQMVVAAHPDVMDCVVRTKRNPISGDDLVAEVVMREGADLSEEAVQQYCATRLPAYKIPSRVSFKDRLETTRTGKVQS
jgi:long-chain acyl-CoA synthetase